MSRRNAAALRVEQAAPIFAALGDETRLALVSRLGSSGPLSITRLTEGSNVTRQAVTKHLQVLAAAGVVRDVKAGRERRWQLQPQRLEEARRTLDEIGRQWDVALGKLKAFVESD